MEDPIKDPGVEASHVEKKAKRRRLKKLCSQIREQVLKQLYCKHIGDGVKLTYFEEEFETECDVSTCFYRS